MSPGSSRFGAMFAASRCCSTGTTQALTAFTHRLFEMFAPDALLRQIEGCARGLAGFLYALPFAQPFGNGFSETKLAICAVASLDTAAIADFPDSVIGHKGTVCHD